MAEDEGGDRKVPTVVMDEEASPERLLHGPRRLTRADLLRVGAAAAAVVLLLALLVLLAWWRLRIRSLLTPVPHRARPAAGAR